jgi:hypothetical protein
MAEEAVSQGQVSGARDGRGGRVTRPGGILFDSKRILLLLKLFTTSTQVWKHDCVKHLYFIPCDSESNCPKLIFTHVMRHSVLT